MISLHNKLALFALLLSTSAPAVARQGTPDQAYLGTNLAPLTYFSTEWAFVDAMRQSREWIPQLAVGGPWDTGAQLDLDPDGWPLLQPGQAAGTLMYRDVDGHYPAGTWVCLYDGTGAIEFGFDADTISETPGRIEVDVTPSVDGIYLKLVASDMTDPVRNIRMIMPGFEGTYATQVFHPLFLERLQGYGTLRFTKWQRTNDSFISFWAQRSTPTTYSQATSRGVALELMIDLCNRLGANPWFSIPHLADDDYVQNFATIVRDQLDPDLTVHIEYSNEVWNTVLSQTAYATAQGLAMGFSTNPPQACLFFNSFRAVQIFDIFENVFGSTQRLKRVLASQSVSTWTATQIMDFQSAFQKADALAIGPYFGEYLGSESQAATTVQMTIDEILDACEADLVNVQGHIQANFDEADFRGLDLIGYEGGQHLRGRGIWEDNPTLTALFTGANRHERMGDLYHQYTDMWRNEDGQDLILYTSVTRFTGTGSWGALEWTAQPFDEAPKYRAIREILFAERCAAPVSFCPGAPNSAGPGASMNSIGTPSLVFSDFILQVRGLPPLTTGLFRYAPETTQIPFGAGTQCIAEGPTVGIIRLNPPALSTPNGVAQRQIDFDSPPVSSGSGAILDGSSWHFQFFYRDVFAGQTVNASSALTIEFCH